MARLPPADVTVYGGAPSLPCVRAARHLATGHRSLGGEDRQRAGQAVFLGEQRDQGAIRPEGGYR
jgi:hypothetical protein